LTAWLPVRAKTSRAAGYVAGGSVWWIDDLEIRPGDQSTRTF
jgi:hypothetical protein